MRKIMKVLIVMMVVTSLFVATMGIAFGNSVNERSVLHSQTKFVAVSSTRAEAEIVAAFTGLKNVKIVFTLQSAPLNSSNFSNVSSVLPVEESWEDVLSVVFTHEFPISSTKEYRVKMEVTDWVDGNIMTKKTLYEELTR